MSGDEDYNMTSQAIDSEEFDRLIRQVLLARVSVAKPRKNIWRRIKERLLADSRCHLAYPLPRSRKAPKGPEGILLVGLNTFNGLVPGGLV